MAKSLRIIPDKCTGCMQCELACSWVQTGMFQPSRSLIRVNIFDEQASYAPYTCFQCDEAWCMNACPVNAISIDSNTGAKIVGDANCVGCSICTIACPFGTINYNHTTGKVVKCDLCGDDPQCVEVCPTTALSYIDAEQTGMDRMRQWAEKTDSGKRALI